MTKVYAVASMACKILPIMYGFIDNFSLETTLKIWSITENPPNPSKNELSKIFVEIAFTWILLIAFSPFVSSIIPDKMPEIKLLFPNKGDRNFAIIFNSPEFFNIEIITENITTNPPIIIIVFILEIILLDKTSPKFEKLTL